MKRDMDFIREIMMQVEASSSLLNMHDMNVLGHNDEETHYHLSLLLTAGLISGIDAKTKTIQEFPLD